MSGDDSDVARSPTKRALLALFAVALVARLPGLFEGPWFDEIWLLVRYLRLPFSELVTTYDSDNIHPLYALLAWPLVAVLGEGAWVMRLPALGFGVGSVLLVYLFGVRRGYGRAGLTAAWLLALSPHHIAFSQSARGYTGLLFFTLLAATFFRDLVDGTAAQRRRGGSTTVLLAVSLGLATHVHLTGVFLGVALALAWVVELATGRVRGAKLAPLFGVVGGAGVSLVLHAPILSAMQAFFTREKDDFAATVSQWRDPVWMVREIARSFGLGEALGLVLLAAGALVLVAGFAVAWRRDRTLALVAVLPALAGQGTMWALSRNLWPRFFFSLAGFWVLLVVLGTEGLLGAVLAERGRTLSRWVLTAAVLVFGALSARGVWRLPKQDFTSAVAWVEERRGPTDAVMSAGQAMFPLTEWLETDYAILEEPEALDAALSGCTRGFVVLSSESFTAAYYPDVWSALGARGREVARFPALNRDQDVVVIEVAP